MRYRFIHTQRAEHRLIRLCQTVGVSRSGYDAWCRRLARARARANARLLEHMHQLHRQTRNGMGL